MAITTIEELNSALNNPNEFKRLIKSNFDLRKTAERFPDHAETLIQVVLNDSNEFKRLIEDNFDLRKTAERFPDHAEIFTQPTVEQALKAMMFQSKAAQSYTAGAAAGALASGTPRLPPEMGHHIGLFLDRKTGGRLAQTSKTAAETAAETAEKMQNKNKSPRK